MKITSKDILEAVINKTISIQEARLIINEAYGEESYGRGEGYRYDDDPVEDYGQKDGMCPDCGCKLEADGHCAMCDKQY